MSKHLALFAILLFCRIVAAQFGFFEQMFQGGNPGRQQAQRPPGADHWRTQADGVQCSEYLCPDTLVCVDSPPQCPCPDVEDFKCVIPDVRDKTTGTVICVRGGGCEDVDYHMNAWS